MRSRSWSQLKYHPNPNPKKQLADGMPRSCVYLPAESQLASSGDQFATLYLLHGVGDNEYSWELHGRLSSLVEGLIYDGQIDPLIVVMPFGFASQNEKLERAFPTKDDFGAGLGSLIGQAESAYPFIDKGRRALAGLSMGGKQALEFGLDNLATFNAIGGFSAAIQDRGAGAPLDAIRTTVTRRQSELQVLKLFYLGCGADDDVGGLAASNRELAKHLGTLSLPNVRINLDIRGKHEWGVWRSALREFLCFWLR